MTKSLNSWREQQDRRGIPTIEQTVKLRTPRGRKVQANRLDYNLAYCTDSYIQLTDTSWIKARLLEAA